MHFQLLFKSEQSVNTHGLNLLLGITLQVKADADLLAQSLGEVLLLIDLLYLLISLV